MPGKIKIWGNADNSVMGNGWQGTYPFGLIENSTSWKTIAYGNNNLTTASQNLTLFAIGIKNDGTLWAIGNNVNAKTGLNTTSGWTENFTQIGTDTNWDKISVGTTHALALKTDGSLWVWGSNSNGRTGRNTTSGETLVPTRIGTDNDWTDISAGQAYSLAVKGGQLFSWGSNEFAATGLNTTSGNTLVPTLVNSDTDWTKVAATCYASGYGSQAASLALKGGKLYAWGSNGRFTTGLGLPSTDTVLVPTQVGSLTNWTKITLGAAFAMGIAGGQLYTWGNNQNGMLGTGDTASRNAPTLIGSDTDWEDVSQLRTAAFAIKGGELYSWGSGYTSSPALLNSSTNWTLGERANASLFFKQSSNMYFIGDAHIGQAADGKTIYNQSFESSEGDWDIVESSGTGNYAAIRNGRLYSWGLNSDYLTGQGINTGITNSATQIGTDTNWAKVSFGSRHALAIKTDGTLWVIGNNASGATGRGTTSGFTTTWTQIGTDTNWTDISAGIEYSLAVKGGELFACGSQSSGKLGNNVTSGSLTSFTKIGTDTNWEKVYACIATTVAASFAIKTTGTLWSCGSNSDGKTGLGVTSGSTNVWTQVGSDSTWTMADHKQSTNIVLGINNGELYGWGAYSSSTNLNGTGAARSVPTKVGSLTGWTEARVGYNSLAVRNGQLYTWGPNEYRNLGDGTQTTRTTPTVVGTSDKWLSFSNVLAGTILGIENSDVGAVNTVAPAVTGTVRVGETLATTDGTWTGIPTPTLQGYQWQRSDDGISGWSNISSATNSTYVLQAAEAGKYIRCQVTYGNYLGNVTADSNSVGPTTQLPEVSTPTITGTQRVFETLTASATATAGFPSPTISYQWQRSNDGLSWSNISGETSSTYSLVTADSGKYIRVQATATNSESADTKSSAATNQIVEIPVLQTPTISGTTHVGETLTANVSSTGFPLPTITYQWQRSNDGLTGWHNLSGETNSTLLLVSNEAGKYIRVVVTSTNSEGSDTENSAAVGPVTKEPSVIDPIISGTAEVGETLTASATYAGHPEPVITYQWQEYDTSWSNIAGATSSTYLLTTTQAGKKIRVEITATNDKGSDSDYSPETERVLWDPANTAIPAITYPANLEVGETLTLSNGSWSGYPAPDTFVYSWEISDDGSTGWTAISGQTNNTLLLTSSFTTKYIRGRVDVTTTAGSAYAYSTSTGYIAEDPATIVAPSLSSTGLVEVGETLTVDPGTWSGFPEPSFTYQWQVSNNGSTGWTNISGETTDELVLTNTYTSKFIRAIVTGTNEVGSFPAGSDVFGPVIEDPYNIEAPELSGEPTTEALIITSNGTWGGYEESTFEYEWETSEDELIWTIVDGEEANNIQLTEDYRFLYLRARVIATNSAGTASEYSNSIGPIDFPLEAPLFIVAPTVSGTASAGETLTATYGEASGYPEPTYSGQWQKSTNGGSTWSNIAGETELTYVIENEDASHIIRFVSTATNDEGSDSLASDATDPVTLAPINTVLPQISGQPIVGQTLNVSNGTWAGYPSSSFTYQWQSNDGSGWENITSANTASLILVGDFIGKTIRAVVTATNTIGSASANSAATTGVVSLPSVVTIPSITGTAKVNEELIANPGTWSAFPEPSFTYQWQRNVSGWSNISGETNSTYIITEDDIGYRIRIVVTAINTAGSASAQSLATAIVIPDEEIPSVITNPAITGSLLVGSTLTSTMGTFDGYPEPELSIQWQNSLSETGPWVNITGATSSTYTIAESKIGYFFRTRVTAINSEGSVIGTSNIVGPATPEPSTKSTVLPMTNARLLSIKAPPIIGVPSDSEFGTEQEAPILWLGNADAFVQITMKRSTKTNSTVGGGMADRYKETTVTIPYLTSVSQGSIITVNYNGQQYTWEVREVIEARYDYGMPEILKCYVIKQ